MFKLTLHKHRPLAWRFALLLLVSISLSGCTRFIYNHVDWVIRWGVSDYIDFDRQQRKELHSMLDNTLDWHRISELPRYEAFLAQLRQEMQSTTSPEQFDRLLDQLLGFWHDILARSLPDISKLLASLSDEQVDKFIAKLQQEQEEYLEELQEESESERLEDRAERFAKNIKRFTGKLNKTQLAKLDEWAEDTNGIMAISLTQRQRWQNAFSQTLAIRKTDPQRFQRELYALFVTPENYWAEDYRRLINYHSRKTAELLSELHGSLSDKQRKKLDKSLAKYQRDISILLGKS